MVPATALSAGLSDSARKHLAWWLGTCSAWVFSLVVLGGMTRLTRSGLSMTDWKFTGEGVMRWLWTPAFMLVPEPLLAGIGLQCCITIFADLMHAIIRATQGPNSRVFSTTWQGIEAEAKRSGC